jgi:branched-subunit amino acid aminotransferase/4-amino-4-deoxychorismate lyase
VSSDNKLYAFVRQQLVPLDQACLHVSDLSIQRGYGVFEFFRVHGTQPLFLDEYLARFYRSAELMHLPVPLAEEELKAAIYELIGKNSLELSGVKIILTGGYSANGYDIGEPNLLMVQQPISLPAPALIDRGLKLITHDYVREVPPAKTINYSIGIRLLNQIREMGADDVLYHREGVVTELPRCNFFIVRQDNTITTPSLDVLPGITRRHVLELAGQKYKAEEGTVTLNDIVQAKEAFLTSTTKRILPVVQVGNTLINGGRPGAVTLSLLQGLIALENSQLRK